MRYMIKKNPEHDNKLRIITWILNKSTQNIQEAASVVLVLTTGAEVMDSTSGRVKPNTIILQVQIVSEFQGQIHIYIDAYQ